MWIANIKVKKNLAGPRKIVLVDSSKCNEWKMEVWSAATNKAFNLIFVVSFPAVPCDFLCNDFCVFSFQLPCMMEFFHLFLFTFLILFENFLKNLNDHWDLKFFFFLVPQENKYLGDSSTLKPKTLAALRIPKMIWKYYEICTRKIEINALLKQLLTVAMFKFQRATSRLDIVDSSQLQLGFRWTATTIISTEIIEAFSTHSP